MSSACRACGNGRSQGGHDLDGADLVRDTHLPVGAAALRDKHVVVVGD
jgi:hypothetical protein